MIVYRIEHPDDGLGPYRAAQDWSRADGLDRHAPNPERCWWEIRRMPPPGADGILVVYEHHVFGWRSLDLAVRWWGVSACEELHALGYKIRIYATDQYQIGESGQVAFVKRGSVRGQELSLRGTLFDTKCHERDWLSRAA